MDFSWTDEQLTRKQEAIDFAERELNDDLIARNREGRWSREAWQKCAEFGLLGLRIPEQYGGTDTDILTAILIMEGIGYGCRESALPYALNSQMWSIQPAIVSFGTDSQKTEYLPGLVDGSRIGTLGITEPRGGSDSYDVSTVAEKVDGGYILNGEKAYVTFAPIVDLTLVFATTNPDLGQWGLSAFLVESDSDGFERTPTVEKMGLRTTPFGGMRFSDCFVSDDKRLGPEGAGVSIFTNAMESERSFILASQVGRMQRQLEQSIEFARERQAFGQSIGKFQAVSHRIVDMKVRLETARLLLYKTAWLEQQEKPRLMEAALAKLHLSESFIESSLDAIRTHGARGYVTEEEVERDLRDSIGGVIYSGTSDIQKNIIARLLGL